VIVPLHLIAFALYGLATALALAPFVGLRPPPAPRALAIAFPCAGAAAQVVAVSQLTLFGLGPALSMLALCLVLLQLASERLLRGSAVSFFAAPLATGLVGLAILSGLTPGGGGRGAEAALGRNAWFVMHVVLSVLGVALLALAFIAAALYLLQFRELKARRFGQIFQLFPPLERLDQLNRFALVAGFPALTLGVLLAIGYGARFAGDGGGGLQAAKAQIVWGIFTWVVLGWAVWVRVVRHWAGRRAALASIAGFSAVLLVYVALKLVEPGVGRFL
jgi:ABC-type uncharacterized transport system permease subunit